MIGLQLDLDELIIIRTALRYMRRDHLNELTDQNIIKCLELLNTFDESYEEFRKAEQIPQNE